MHLHMDQVDDMSNPTRLEFLVDELVAGLHRAARLGAPSRLTLETLRLGEEATCWQVAPDEARALADRLDGFNDLDKVEQAIVHALRRASPHTLSGLYESTGRQHARALLQTKLLSLRQLGIVRVIEGTSDVYELEARYR